MRILLTSLSCFVSQKNSSAICFLGTPVALGLFGLRYICPPPYASSLLATCSPVYPTGPCRCLLTPLASTHLSLVSTSKQKRLSMESDFRRMQDLSVSCVGPWGRRRGTESVETGKWRKVIALHLFRCVFLLTWHHEQLPPLLVISAVIFHP